MLMTTHAGVGMSRHHNPNVAGREAAEQALKKAGVDEPDFVLMFASIGYDQHTLLRTVRETIGGAPLSGCSVEGTIAAEDADETNYCVVVTAISSDELQWTNGLATGLSADSRAVGQQVAQELLPHLSADTIGLFVFPDGMSAIFDTFFTANFDDFLAGLEGSLPSDRFLPLWGGGAGNNFDAGAPTYQYCDDEVVSDAVAYTLLSGRARVGWAMSHSLIPIGGARIVTRCKGNVIYEIDGKPAAEVLKEYLPEQVLAKDEDWLPYSISLALCFRAPNYMKDEEHVVRGIPAVKMADESITVQTEVSEGTSIWFSSRDKEKVATGLDRMAAQIKEQIGGEKPKLVLQFDCATRGKMMFREHEKLQLLKRLRQSVGPGVPWVGFYAFGEIGPVEEHNNRNLYTAVALALG
jgi:hypothetical protein